MRTIDIILLCYNQERYIEQALRSIYAQELPEDVKASIIVADDASSDGTLDIIQRFAPESPFPVVFLPAESNVGISRNYKRSFAVASADYVAILEGDDYWLPNHIAMHIDFLEKHLDCTMSMNRFYSTSDTNEERTISKWNINEENYLVDLHLQIATGNQLGNLSACCFRTKNLQQLPDDMYELHVDDFLLGIMMAREGYIAILKEPTSIYRCNQNSMWASMSMIGKYKRNMYFAETYDNFLNRQYHEWWLEYKKNIRRLLWVEIRTEIAHKVKRIVE